MIDGYSTKQLKILIDVPQGDTTSPYPFILVLEILLLRIKLNKDLTFLRFEKSGYDDTHGGTLKYQYYNALLMT